MSTIGERQDAFRSALAAEPDWQALLRHFDFSEHFALILIFVESAENAAVCREALGDYLRETGKGSIRLIAPRNPEEAQNLPYLLHRPKGLYSAQTLWIESVVPEGSVTAERFEEWRAAWRSCFASLNQIRNQMQRTIPCALVFAVASWMEELIRNIAPDLWSIRSTIARISIRTGVEGSGGSRARTTRRAESDPALAPDPEFAEREASRLRGKPGHELALARVLQRAGEGYLARAELSDAIRVLEEALDLQSKVDAAPAEISQTRTLLGRAYQSDAQWSAAERYFREALEMDLARLDENSPTIATDLSDLAQLLQATNRPSEAEPLMRRALAIDERSYGPDHPRVAADLNNLAQLLKATNLLSEAEPLMRRALAIDERSYGPDHPSVATRLNNLAGLLRVTNRLSEAEPLMRRALAIDERSYGPDHPRVATYLNNLAQLLQATSRLTEAEPLMRHALVIDERSYGPDHPDVAIDLSNLARLLQRTNRLSEAEPLMRRAVQILEAARRNSGHELPSLSIVRKNYRLLAEELGWTEEEAEERLRNDSKHAVEESR